MSTKITDTFWAVIPILDEQYEINREGTVIRRCKYRSKGYRVPMRENKYGYLSVQLMDEAPVNVHRLVLLAFVGHPPEDKPFGLHSDGDRKNNHIDNLRWGSTKQNAKLRCAELGNTYDLQVCSR